MTTPHTIPDLKKQVREEFMEEAVGCGFGASNMQGLTEFHDCIIDRTLAFAKEATLLEEDTGEPRGFTLGWNEAIDAQLKKWEELQVTNK